MKTEAPKAKSALLMVNVYVARRMKVTNVEIAQPHTIVAIAGNVSVSHTMNDSVYQSVLC